MVHRFLSIPVDSATSNCLYHKNRRLQPSEKTVYKKKSYSSRPTSKVSKTEKQKRIDEILDKISKSGYDSLTKEEKDFLFKAGKDL